VKLLRFLQDKMIQRVGGREDISVDTRIIAATNKDLSKEIRDGRFREDLFYRIGVVLIKIPPLRERNGDIVLLATYFLNPVRDLYGKRVRGFVRPPWSTCRHMRGRAMSANWRTRSSAP